MPTRSVDVVLFRLPLPLGPTAVGSVVIALRTPRAPVQVWYPARGAQLGRSAPYRPTESPAGRRARLQWSLIRTRARVEAPPARGPHPLLLYVPGWNCGSGENTVFAQDLASRGYIVMALSDQVADAPLDFSSEAASRVTQGRGDRYVRRAATQISTILDDLLDGQDAGRLTATGGIDRTRIGICGFSFGGAVAAESTRADPRLRAAANLDGWMFGEAAAEGVPKPYIIIGTGMRPPLAEEIPPFERRFDAVNEQQILAGLGRHGGFYLSVDGTTHFSFTDAPLLPSLRSLRATTPLGARRLRGIIATYVGQFFDRYVGGAKAPLFDTPVAHVPVDPAVHVKTWRAPLAPLLITDSRDERS